MSSGQTAAPSGTLAAIRQAALELGWSDPQPIVDDLLVVDVDALHEWFTTAAMTRVRLWQGTRRLDDALPMLAVGWSSPAPALAIVEQQQAGLAGRDVIGGQVDAADAAVAILRQSKVLAHGALADAVGAIHATGWPPGADLLRWATEQHRLLEVSGTVSGLCHELTDLQSRNAEALQTLAQVLRADPRDAVERVAAALPAASAVAPGSAAETPGNPAGGPAAAGPQPAGSGVGGSGVDGSEVDSANLDRLAQDLQSTDIATLAMALGVGAALEKARAAGGVAQLLVYESANSGSQGRAAVSVGDITTADNVAVLAPGVTNAPVSMADSITDAAAMRDASQLQSPGDSTAVVAWFGYDIPLSFVNGVPVDAPSMLGNAAAALDDGNARAGGALLAGDLEQFHDWAPETARFVTVGFSMGATTVSAASARGARVDDMVLLGSPGASNDVETAADYPDLPAEHTFVTAFDQDAVTRGQTDLLADLVGSVGPFSGEPTPFGPDPAAAEFGAQVIDVQTTVTAPHVLELPFLPLSGPANDAMELAVTHQESNYLSGDSLAAVAAVVTGQYSEVPIKLGR